MQDTKKNLSLGEAAKIAACSRDTVRRAAQRQELPAKMGPGKRGPQWWVREADLLDWVQQRQGDFTHTQQQPTEPKQAQQSTSATAENVIEDAVYDFTSPSKTSRSDDAEQSKASLAEQVTEIFDYDAPIVSADVHQTVISELVEELRRADRQVIALQMQLSQNSNLLAEKTDTLLKQEAEEKALAEQSRELQIEKEKHAQQAKQAEQELQQALQQAEQRDAELAEVRAQAQQSAAELAELQSELEKQKEIAKRPWWKKMFGD